MAIIILINKNITKIYFKQIYNRIEIQAIGNNITVCK